MHLTVYEFLPELESYYEKYKSKLPLSLIEAINNLGEEEVPFAGDELAVLAEETIRATCGLVAAAYLQGDTGDDELNMQIITLFMGHKKFTPGSMLGLSRQLGKNLTSQKVDADILHFAAIINDNSVGDENGILSQGLNFRNNLMHGTFLAPAARVKAVILNLLTVLKRIAGSGAPEFRVIEGEPCAGNVKLPPFYTLKNDVIDLADSWNVTSLPGDGDIRKFIQSQEATWTRFADLFIEYLDEISGVFLEKEKSEAIKIAGELPPEVQEKLDSGVTSLGLVTWWNTDQEGLWGAVTKYLSAREDVTVLSWRMHKGSIRYYREVLLGALETVLLSKGIEKTKNESTMKFLDRSLGAFTEKQVLWVVVDGFHHNMNRDVHFRHTLDLLAERGVRLVASGYGYPELARHFTDRVEVFTGNGTLPSVNELVDQWSSFSGLDDSVVIRINEAAGRLMDVVEDHAVQESSGFRMEQSLSLRRLHDNIPAFADYSLHELEYAAAALAPVLTFTRQEHWLEYNPRGGMEDSPVVFYTDFSDMADYKKFEPEKRLYRMFRHSVYPDRKQTEVDPVYETMGRDDIALEYRPLSVARIKGGI